MIALEWFIAVIALSHFSPLVPHTCGGHPALFALLMGLVFVDLIFKRCSEIFTTTALTEPFYFRPAFASEEGFTFYDHAVGGVGGIGSGAGGWGSSFEFWPLDLRALYGCAGGSWSSGEGEGGGCKGIPNESPRCTQEYNPPKKLWSSPRRCSKSAAFIL